MRTHLNIAAKTDTGQKRKKNEDTFVVDPEVGLMIVADGMGGHAAGDVASKLASSICKDQAVRALKSGHVPVFTHVPPNPDLDKRSLLLGDCVKFSNQAVHEAAQKSETTKNMGTTIVAALWLEGKLAVAHVGDSRLYMVRDGDITQCTTDHSFVQEQVDRGFLKPEEAEKSEMRNMLTRSVGISEDVEVDVNEIDMLEGDYILICSDGLTKMLDDDQIAEAFQSNQEPGEIVDRLIHEANQAGGNDNVTAVVAKVTETPSHWKSLTSRVKHIFNGKAD